MILPVRKNRIALLLISIAYLSMFALLAGCSSCNSGEEKICKRTLDYQLAPTGEYKKFALPNDVLCYAVNLQLYKEQSGRHTLYFLGQENTIMVYDWKSEKLLRRINLEERGPDGVGKANGFQVITPDSILITSQFVQKISFVDSTGHVLSKFDFRKEKLGTSSTNSSLLTPVYSDGETFLLPQKVEGNWSALSLSELEKYRTTLLVNLQNSQEQIEGKNIPYEKDELKHKTFGYSITRTESNYVVSFTGSDSIFVSNDLHHFTGYDCRSAHVFGKLAAFNFPDPQKALTEKIKSCYYNSIVYDPYRKVIYRFYMVGEKEVPASADIFTMSRFPAQVGIMVIDEHMHVIANQVLRKATYFAGNYFIAPEGLYLSINYPTNPDMDVNKLAFELIRLEKKNS